MSDIDISGAGQTDTGDTSKAAQAKQALGHAGQTLKQEAQSFASVAQERARTEAQKQTQAATRTLGDFANAIRRAGDELAQSDQSPASRLVRQAADGLENFSRSLADKQPEDLLNNVRDFGRRNPMAFIGGAVLVGLALGRFVRATDGDRMGSGGGMGRGGYSGYGAGGGMSGGTTGYDEPRSFSGGASDVSYETGGMSGTPMSSLDRTGAAATGAVGATAGAAGSSLSAPLADDLGGLAGAEDDTSVAASVDGMSGLNDDDLDRDTSTSR